VFIACLEGQTLWILVIFIVKLWENGDVQDHFGIGLASLIGVFGCLMTTLVGFQTWVMAKNCTTCIFFSIQGEFIKREKITYLQIYPEIKFPFDQGLLKNLYLYWKFKPNGTFIKWAEHMKI
jgi:hypothetical protein